MTSPATSATSVQAAAQTVATSQPAAHAVPRTQPQLPRVDLYGGIHKALRLFMTDTLARVGWLDADDPADVAAALGQVGALLELCRRHVEHENTHVHPAIEARRPGASAHVAEDHEEHLQSIAALEAEAAALRALPTANAALRLYRHLASFVGENFQHMHWEETQHNAALWAAYSDEELMQIHVAIVSSVPPAEMLQIARWMVPALNPAERAEVLGGMKAAMPASAFEDLLDAVRPHLSDKDWAKLARALHLPERPFAALMA